MLGEFSNKIAVVTGGSRGIGREIALELARSGAQTVIVSSSADNLAGAAKTIAAAGPAPFSLAVARSRLTQLRASPVAGYPLSWS
jgi:NAD(P)-dependent dehydrogenase (short-subunit alcohol dehydrogenase family)